MDEGFANEIAKAYLVAGVNERASGSTLFCGLGVHSTTAAPGAGGVAHQIERLFFLSIKNFTGFG
jgi:hypothetical protein